MDLSRFLQAARQGCVSPLWHGCYHKDSPSPPPAPDYTGAAVATGAANQEAARVAAKANRVSQYTPYGNLIYTPGVNGDQDQWRSDVSLSPTGQKLLDYSNESALGLGEQQNQALQRVDQSLSQPFDQQSVGDVADQSYAMQTARLDPQWQAKEDQEYTRLANQGLSPGGEAYDANMRNFNQARNDAYGQARLSSINTMPQTYQLAQALRSQPLNELNALRTGSQVTNPTFQVAPQQQTMPGTNYLGATQAQSQYDMGLYNSQVAQNNSMMNGMMGLAGTIGGAMMMSDPRTKKNIKQIGEDPRGFGIYKFNYLWDKKGEEKTVGVMADEVEKVIPEAVVDIGGVKAVDYGRI